VRVVSWWFRFALVVTAGALLVTAVVTAVAPRLWQMANAHDQTPVSLPALEPIAQRTYVYDRAGNEIAAYELENSQPVPIDRVPDEAVAALLAVEDREFYTHHGVNVRSLFRASLSNFEGGTRQGASTITQQVVKIDYLAGLERDGRYKLLQIVYALRLEKILEKDEILERYLNTVYFGNNAYGIQAAAEVYFGKSVDDLTLIDGAFLAGLVQAPSSYDPIRRPERSRQRFLEVLEALVEDELLSSSEAEGIVRCLPPYDTEDAEEAEARKIECKGSWQIPELLTSIEGKEIERTHFSEAVKDYLLNGSDLLGDTYEERYYRLFRGGLRIHTTLDPVVQEAAEAAKKKLPDNAAGIEASVVTLDSVTGAIRAMVGGPDFEAGVNEVNLALATRQTGSSIKMFVLAAAVQAGVQNDDLLDGERPCVLPNPDDPENPFLIEEGVSRALGPVDEMTWYSINCAFSRLAQMVGLDRVVDTTYRMASNPYLYRAQSPAEREPLRPYASFATGANEMSALDMAAGAQTLANNGLHMEPYYVERIEGPDGAIVYQHADAGVRVFSEDAAARTTRILEGVMVSGTARRSALEGRVSAGKTGTQDNNTNAWFVGYTPELVTAVWVGHPDLYLPMNNIEEFLNPDWNKDGIEDPVVPKVQGGTYPAFIWKATMDAALFGTPPSTFRAPPANPRPAMRLVLPGVDCWTATTTIPPVTDPPTTIPPVTDPVTGETLPVTVTSTTTTTTTSTTSSTTSTSLAPGTPSSIDLDNTIPRGVVDPTYPVPTLVIGEFDVGACPG